MQNRHLFEYAVIRVVLRVEREEFINVGVILYCAKTCFLKCLYHLDESRLTALCKKTDSVTLNANLDAFQHICDGTTDSGLIGQLDAPSRFRWLTATRSTVLQTSKVHPGFCEDPAAKLQQLFNELVLIPE